MVRKLKTVLVDSSSNADTSTGKGFPPQDTHWIEMSIYHSQGANKAVPSHFKWPNVILDDNLGH